MRVSLTEGNARLFDRLNPANGAARTRRVQKCRSQLAPISISEQSLGPLDLEDCLLEVLTCSWSPVDCPWETPLIERRFVGCC